MGHIIADIIGNKGIEIAKQAYYNIYGKELSNGEIIDFLEERISEYSTYIRVRDRQKKRKTVITRKLCPKYYLRLIPRTTVLQWSV